MKSVAKLVIFPDITKKGFPFKIRITNERKQKYIGLKFYISESDKKRYWNSKKGELLPSYKNYNEIMIQFNIELKKIGIDTDKKISNEPIIYSSSSFSKYFEKYMENLKINSQFGLLQKTTTVQLHLNNYIKSKGIKAEIHFSDIDIDFLNDFKNFLTNNKIKPVTQRGYIEKIRAIINLAIEEDKYNPHRHPFSGFKFNTITTQPKHLNPDEFQVLNNLIMNSLMKIYNIKTGALVEFPYKLKLIGMQWLFQYYCYGMRISDLLLLRWKDISEVGKRITYTMYKTKNEMDISVNNELLDILFEFFPVEDRNEIRLKSTTKFGEGIVYIVNTTDGKKLKFNKNNEYYSYIRNKLYNFYGDTGMREKRIFSKISSENDNPKEIYTQIATRTAVYNKNLKRLSTFLNSVSNHHYNISSHMARHTFAYLALLQDKDTYLISKALNHKSIKTTETYLDGFPLRHLDNKFYHKEFSVTDKLEIDKKIKELLASSDYEKKKKWIDLLSL